MNPEPALLRLLEEAGDPDNPTPRELRSIVRRTMTIAVVGASRDPMKPARFVPSYLAAKGAEILPVNPNAARILGRPSRRTLEEIEVAADVVLVFRPPHEAAEIVRKAVRRPEHPVVWLQEGIRADDAAREARASGHTVVQSLCMFKVHRALGDTLRRVGAGGPQAPR